MAQAPIVNASIASPTHVANQTSLDGSCVAINAVSSALTPIRIPPTPGTAVNEPACSMVSRIYLRFSKALSLIETTFADFMSFKVSPLRTHVKYFAEQSQEDTGDGGHNRPETYIRP